MTTDDLRFALAHLLSDRSRAEALNKRRRTKEAVPDKCPRGLFHIERLSGYKFMGGDHPSGTAGAPDECEGSCIVIGAN